MKIVHTDVFALKEGGGNPCPVVLDGDGQTSEEMQQMAKEFGVECVFVEKGTHKNCEWKLRYFVPNNEMSMCVHATIGAVTVLVEEGRITQSPTFIETELGEVEVQWKQENDVIFVTVKQWKPTYQQRVPSRQELCEALQINEHDFARFLPEIISTSRSKLLVPIKDEKTLHTIEPDFNKLWSLCDKYETTGFYPFAIVEGEENTFQARQFPNNSGYKEDSATGVAASALSVYAVKHQLLHDPSKPSRIIQGVAMGKPSVIMARPVIENDSMIESEVIGTALVHR
ncbi:PhzF family phenazine biosynthesis protein [Metabacillus iocasae]|uniref:PhzF family phenazine biosynthesis protein n=1 Tax=Priestia iocasae TaxID=2291674 RepID=A0ABS2QUJ2_9BACI|nr:PhzF family phenazine biosynthesis protein [Metabacillus iocasae]MBM7703097.1 PhzF family phenazine biosynthesis protein [Metabacillus iocasae]